ncbi:AsmA family protein, partial [Desulfosarcina sp. OttesenSCG-928-G17]|nr:AsmA family protein [Desulfosarcina sp. OttesenSCG-928-G17]
MLKKIIIALTAGLIVLMIGVGILIKIMITPEMVRESVLPIAEQHLNRKIDYTDIAIGLFSGIYVSDLKIMERGDTGDFVSVGKMALQYRFLPLLWGKVEISKIVLDHPRINIVRFTDKTFNFTDLLAPSRPDTTAPATTEPTSDSGSKMALEISEIHITEGELYFTDQAISPESPFSCVLN